MSINKVKEIKDLYENRFKCIKYEFADSGDFTVYLKNFEEEKTNTVVIKDEKEISDIKNFIDNY
ncbi:hypothetical protein Curi_c19790 [Gottschalkia acidurici 9a]|uniref:Uncharacterized protein n=1 Tax=Gottschalkia acidurici (strain ATCC 7906 / DSM 604 / BCRC 14475 / CIP 104303 / KCTC 5404 / NCIMB 10678 / 9a) TaxID=1128398 RepID=K0AYW4_GOTA9|nr:hypothetical protein [Gottschalkia acidurici]AFS78983.1 hypothetical protein Curi_c19790 [Gottschalkia acidurici 9a]